ncbi:MAG: MCE family protein [Verrucomicrobia bacterium]|nr:MCE family protein [Verrucomicrobiota bacterium]MCG2681933.1 MlaD family protein [Kiritimatiellia bacterium]MBU4247133.1 MCE family protein [Verrucomicrobiota bacterium]MBU4290974.1 MCE family protein [Verrucomicrobiota bacterium]MBU4430431.1 MCE family protein [Verrucomicrobiota bacterium]
MKRTSKARELTMEVVVGSFMFAALLSLCFFTILLSRENFFKTTYPFEVVFEDVMGLRDGDNVVIRGMMVGKVKELALKEDGVHIQSALLRPVTLKQDYKIEIIATSVLGGRYLQIDEGKAAEVLPPEVVVRGLKPNDLIAIASAVVADLKNITMKINSREGTLGKLINDDALYNDARDIVAEVKTSIKERHLLKNIETVAANLGDISEKINKGQGTIGKLVNDDGLYTDTRRIVGDIRSAMEDRGLLDNLEGSVANLNAVSEKINSGAGTLGKLVNDDDLYQQAKKTMIEVRAAVDDLRETSPIVTFSSIYFGAF